MNEEITVTINQEFRRLNRLTLGFLFFLMIAQVVISYILFIRLGTQTFSVWFREMLIATAILLAVGAVALYALYRARMRVLRTVAKSISIELSVLRAANDRAQSLQAMASTLSATLSFERVVEQALDVCSLALQDMGIPRESLVGAVFLYDGSMLVPLARRRFLDSDGDKMLTGKRGAVGEALRQAEPTVTDNPGQDPELNQFVTFADSLTVVCIPLRAGYQLFGVMVLGIDTAVHFVDSHFELFSAVADHAVIALQNAQLYQRLEAEKQRLIEADEKARRELARDLHDGPTQNIAVIAMHLNVLRSMVVKDPQKAQMEIRKIEELAKRTSREIRAMLFTLRPLLLETGGLGPAIKRMMNHIGESDDIEMHLIGGDNGTVLNKTAQGVVFSIVEEALSNARKHAMADVIEVRLWQEDDLFVVRVTDDGAGFDPEIVRNNYSERGSLGMINMQERAERIDSTFTIESAPGTGTTITLLVPVTGQGQQEPDELETADLETAVPQ